MSEKPAGPVVPVEERLFSLVLALTASEQGLTKSEILGAVQGYRQRYHPGGDNASLERLFERDKDDVRDLGIPLEAIESPGDPGNNQATRYRISKGDYDLPADVTFTQEESSLLALAALVWREGSLSGDSRRALLKLRSQGLVSSESLPGYRPSIKTRDDSFAPLSSAMDKAVRVSFSYVKPGEPAARRRTVEPLALVQHLGRWHLYAIDTAVSQPRTFLLSRIGTDLALSRTTFVPPAGDHSDTALAELKAVWERFTAVIDVKDSTDAAVRLHNRTSAHEVAPGRITFSFGDVHLLADELAQFGPEIFVVEPAELREAVRERLRAARDVHERTDGV